MDALQLMCDDHRTAQGLIDRYNVVPTQDARREAAISVVDELTRHTAVEVHMLHPLLTRLTLGGDAAPPSHLDTREELQRSVDLLRQSVIEDHGGMDHLINELRDNLARHCDFEEGYVHPVLSRALDKQARDELGDILAQAKTIAPNSATTNSPGERSLTFTIPIATFCDRLRDRLGDRAPL